MKPAERPGDPAPLGVLLAIVDFPMLATGYRSVIDAEPDLAVVGEVDGRDDLVAALERTGAAVVITECLPYDGATGCTSYSSIETVRAARPATRSVALECRCSSDQFSLALKAGADGFLTREAAPADVVSAVRCVARGQTYVSPAIVTRMVNTYVLRTPERPLEDAYETLNDREREVLLLAAIGHTNREIARTLHLSEQTIHNYRANVMEKLGFHDRVELLKFALKHGLIRTADL